MTSVHVDTGREWRGGQGQVLRLLIGLRDHGDTPILVAPAGAPLVDRARGRDFKVFELPLRGEWDMASVFALRRIIGATQPAIVHTHTAHALTLAGLAAIGTGARVVAARRVDFRVSRVGRLKLLHLADRVVCVSQAVRDILADCGVSGSRVKVVWSGVVLPPPAGDRTPLRRELGVGDRPLIGTIGALVDHKDHHTLIAAAAHLGETHAEAVFAIAGIGDLALDLGRAIHDRGLGGRVHLLGFREDTASLRAAFDMFVLPSKLEGLGTTVLDAMAVGLPIVATRTGGIPEMIVDGETGLLVEPGNPLAMARAIARLLDDPELARRLGENAKQLVGEHFSAEGMVEKTRAIYQDAVAG